jgi:hypothetical protein
MLPEKQSAGGGIAQQSLPAGKVNPGVAGREWMMEDDEIESPGAAFCVGFSQLSVR